MPIALATALAATGCGDDAARQGRLVDGTRPPVLPAALAAAARNAVATRVTALHVDDLDEAGRSCVAGFRGEFRVAKDATVVRRTGVVGESLTFLDADRDVVLGCDRTNRPAPASRRWCGRSVGLLIAGRLHDVRVDIACRTRHGTQVGFGWIQPGSETHWVAVRAGPGTEITKVTPGLPLRIVTEDVDPATSSATFTIVEYASAGRALRSYRVRAGVAG